MPSLFYLVAATITLLVYWLFGEKLDALPLIGIDICVMGVVLANRAAAGRPARPTSRRKTDASSRQG